MVLHQLKYWFDGKLDVKNDSPIGLGWGESDTPPNNFLKQIDFKINSIEDHEILVHNPEGSACYGDSGGPLFIQSKNEWFIAGIAHAFIMDEAGRCQKGAEGAYVPLHVKKNNDWIAIESVKLKALTSNHNEGTLAESVVSSDNDPGTSTCFRKNNQWGYPMGCSCIDKAKVYDEKTGKCVFSAIITPPKETTPPDCSCAGTRNSGTPPAYGLGFCSDHNRDGKPFCYLSIDSVNYCAENFPAQIVRSMTFPGTAWIACY